MELDVSVELYTPDGFLFKASPKKTNVAGIQVAGKIGRTYDKLRATDVVESNEDFELGDRPGRDSLDGLSYFIRKLKPSRAVDSARAEASGAYRGQNS